MGPSSTDRLAAPEWPIVGRASERAAIEALLGEGARLITLHGTAGVGKSRLALACALDRHDVVIGCGLEGIATAPALTRELAARLEVPLASGDEVAHEKRVLGSLAARGRLVIVLDACESLDPDARALVARVLETASGVRILATSQRPLGIAGEQRVPIGPLPPDDAIALFLARVRAVRPSFALRSDEERVAIEEIVRTLEGLPLALELAAARLRALAPSQLQRMLAHRLEVLTGPSEGRHASLAAALDASWELLAPVDRRALAALARFVGPFALETAAHVIAEDPDAALAEIRASARLDELVRASLVTATPSEGDEGPRFSLLESIRDYARARARELDEPPEAEARFADAVLARAAALVPRSRREPAALRTLLAEGRSLEAVLAWASRVGDDTRAIRALACLARETALRGPGTTFLEAAARVRPRVAIASDLDAIALLRGIGQVATSAGCFAEASSAYAEATTRAEPDLAALFDSRIALFAHYAGDDAGATVLLDRALSRLRPESNAEMRGRVHEAIGMIALRRGDHARARDAFVTTLAAARSLGMRDLEGRALGYLAWCELEAGWFETARRDLARASELCASMAERRYADAFAGDVGLALYEEGALDEARTVLTDAVAAHVRRGDRWYEADHLGHLGMVVFAAGQLGEARTMLARASAMHETGRDRGQAALFRALEAAVCSEARDAVSARRAIAEARVLATDVDTPVPRAIALLEGALALGEPADDPGRAKLAASVALALETPATEVRMPARALAASLARVEARERAAPSEAPTLGSDALAFSDPLHAARVKLHVQARLFGGTPEVLRVGRFEVLRRIGAGAMSVVYAACDPELGRSVALKLLQDEVQGERLRREARALARLRHPHVVAVYDVGTWNRHFFMALELVEGQPLGAWRAAVKPTADDVVRVMRDVADGLAAVHDLGLVHRDVKPDNIVVDASGRPRLVDFGLVSASEDERELEPAPSGPPQLTRDGASPGTPRYMAPECKDGAAATALSDQFSFAVSLEEVIDGLAVPETVREAARRGRENDPAQRFPSMHALRAALSLPSGELDT